MSKKRSPQLAAMLIGSLSLWAIACVALHGPVILAYVAIQLATSGVFAWQMHKIEKSIPKHSLGTTSQAGSAASKAA